MRKIITKEVNNLLTELERSLKIRRYSEETKKRYRTVLKGYLHYEEKREKNLRELTENDVIEYLNYLTEERKYKASSYNNVNAILKYFLEVVLERDISYRRLPNAKIGYRRVVVVNKEEFKEMLKNAKTTRTRCFLALAYGSGLRVSEIARLRIKNIDSKNMKIIEVGKGDKERITVLPKRTLVELRKYCKEKNITKESDYIFLNREKEALSPATVSYEIKKVSDESGIKKSAHKLRGGFATEMLRKGVDIMVVQALLGHTSPETTSKYSETVRIEDKIINPLDGEFNE